METYTSNFLIIIVEDNFKQYYLKNYNLFKIEQYIKKFILK